MRFSTAVIGLLFGLEAAALRAGTRSIPEIEREVCARISVGCDAQHRCDGTPDAKCQWMHLAAYNLGHWNSNILITQYN